MFTLKKNIQLGNLTKQNDSEPLKLVWIEKGIYLMGMQTNHHKSNQNNLEEDDITLSNKPRFRTEITKGFWLGETPISQLQWENIGNLPIKSKSIWKEQIDWKKDGKLPVFGLSWLEAMTFCKYLNMMYKGHLPEGYHFSLPTELNWEYACRTNQPNENSDVLNQKSVDTYSHHHLYKVKQHSCNDWGVYDMLGNIREWCYDIAAYYPSDESYIPNWIGNQDNENWFDYNEVKFRAVRGIYQATYREYANATIGFSSINPVIGFRICLRPITQWDLNDPLLQREGINMLG